MVSQADLVRGSLKKLSKKTKMKIKEVITDRGQDAAVSFLTGIITSKTGLPPDKARKISNIIVKKSVKEIRDKLKR